VTTKTMGPVVDAATGVEKVAPSGNEAADGQSPRSHGSSQIRDVRMFQKLLPQWGKDMIMKYIAKTFGNTYSVADQAGWFIRITTTLVDDYARTSGTPVDVLEAYAFQLYDTVRLLLNRKEKFESKDFEFILKKWWVPKAANLPQTDDADKSCTNYYLKKVPNETFELFPQFYTMVVKFSDFNVFKTLYPKVHSEFQMNFNGETAAVFALKMLFVLHDNKERSLQCDQNMNELWKIVMSAEAKAKSGKSQQERVVKAMMSKVAVYAALAWAGANGSDRPTAPEIPYEEIAKISDSAPEFIEWKGTLKCKKKEAGSKLQAEPAERDNQNAHNSAEVKSRSTQPANAAECPDPVVTTKTMGSVVEPATAVKEVAPSGDKAADHKCAENLLALCQNDNPKPMEVDEANVPKDANPDDQQPAEAFEPTLDDSFEIDETSLQAVNAHLEEAQ